MKAEQDPYVKWSSK